MRTRFFLLCLISTLWLASPAGAQVKSDLVQSRVLILLDESSSMIQEWSGKKEKYKAARDIILKIMDSVYAYNPDVEFSLRVFGHQYTVKENNCYDTKNEVAFNKNNRTQMDLRLSDIRPLGVTPIAYALTQAAEHDLTDELHYAYSIILITDGGESCGGDLCQVMRSLIANKVFFKPYIVGLEDAPELKMAYDCMGNFLSVTRQEDVPGAVSKIVETFRPIIKVTKSEFKDIQALGASAPSVLKINTPLPKAEPPAPPVVKKEEPPVKKEPELKLPPVPNISHVPAAPALDYELLPGELGHIGLAPVPPAPDEERPALPPVPNIGHIPMAPLIELEGTHQEPGRMKPAGVPPAGDIVPETPELPAVTPIRHMTVAGLTSYEIAPPEPMPVSKVAVPGVEDQVVVLPKVTAIPHMALSGSKVPEVVPAEPERLLRRMVPAVDAQEQPQLPQVAKVNHISPPAIREMEMPTASTTPLKRVPMPPPPVMDERETSVLPKVEKIAHVAPLMPSTHDVKLKDDFSPHKANVPGADYKEQPPLPTVEKVARVKMAKPIEPRVIFIIEDHPLKRRTPPDAPPFAVPVAAAPTLPKAVPSAPEPAGPPTHGASAGYTVETLDAKTTGLMVYFTNGHGKFYTSTPSVVLLSGGGTKVAKKFYRTVDPDGNPDVQTDIPTGIFDIAISDKGNTVLHDVEITAGKLNKVIVKLKNCSLAFEYDRASSRPVNEFVATVIQRNVPNGKVINQKCTQKLEYEPGNYHIVVHTYPEDVRNVDLDFDDTKVILIPQPGYAKITTDMRDRKLNFYKPVNDRFLQFDTRNSSDTALRHLQIQPGQYQIRYLKDPTKPYIKETIISFSVKSNDTSAVELPSI